MDEDYVPDIFFMHGLQDVLEQSCSCIAGLQEICMEEAEEYTPSVAKTKTLWHRDTVRILGKNNFELHN